MYESHNKIQVSFDIGPVLFIAVFLFYKRKYRGARVTDLDSSTTVKHDHL